MAYNKTKLIESAQKYLNQGKVAQAIAEYQQILRHEPKDQVTLMTVGDLYVRQGETFHALEYFERLAQVFLSDGFVSKAIAIYKKIAKLAPEESRALERLAELYIHQGVLSEARPLYLQLAETHLRAKRHPEAVALLRKLLEAEPDNLRVQMRLAELYSVIGQPKEAAETFLSASERMLTRGDNAEARKLATRALELQPDHAGALLMKARALAASGKRSEAISLLETLPDPQAGSDATALLLDLYLQAGASERAAALAEQVFERTQQYELPYKVASALVEAGEADRALSVLGRIRGAMTEAGDHERLAHALAGAAERSPRALQSLEWLVELYGQASDAFHLPDALGQLAQAAVAAGQLERAKEAYEQLLDRAPEDETIRQQLNQVRAQLRLKPVEPPVGLPRVSQPAAAPAEAEGKPATPAAETPLDEGTERFIAQALTDVDLFSSYGLTQKAVDLLETVLQRAPRHTAALEKLLDLFLGAGDERRTAELAARLEQIHLEHNDSANAERFAELRRRFQRAAGLTREELAAAALAEPPPEFPAPAVEAEPLPLVEAQPVLEEDVPGGEAAVHEVDLSEEWAALADELEKEEPAPPADVLVKEFAPATEQDAEVALNLDEVESAAMEAQEEIAAEPTAATSADDFLTQLAKEFEVFRRPARTEAALASAPVRAEAPATTTGQVAGPLHEVFEEFRAELGEMSEDEDPETHYNLGIAYREMGLLEEAIGEFQKVVKLNDKGRAFRYAMQCCTLLGLAFMERGQPAIAAMWYERALQTPGLDQECILALRYDLGVAQELAGDAAAALRSFSQVYAINIDYRDVAERIATLQKRG